MTDSVTGSTTESMPRVLGRPAELMLVEDNYGDILLTQEAFRACKIANRLHIARDGEEALKMLRKEAPYGDLVTPDLILLDLNLPRKDGREVLAEIKSTRELATILVAANERTFERLSRAGTPQTNDRSLSPVAVELVSR